jgi:hypothetical protein
MERRFGLLSDTIPERPAELRPIPCPHRQGQQQGKRSSSLKKYSAIHVQGEAPKSDDSSRDCEVKRVHLSLARGCVFHLPILSVRVFARPIGYWDFSRTQESFMVTCGWRHVVLFIRGHVAENLEHDILLIQPAFSKALLSNQVHIDWDQKEAVA